MGRPARIAGILSGCLALFAGPSLAQDRSRFLMEGFDGFQTSTLKVNGVEIGYRRAGTDGPTVILIHGWPDNGYSWREVAADLSESYDVIVPDYRGVCGSSVPEDGYDKAIMAADILALMNELGADRVHLVGHDIGMAIAFAFAQDSSERLASLTMIEGVIPGTETEAQLLAAGQMWHFGFHANVDFAMDLIEGQVPFYLGHFFDTATATDAAIGPDARAFYADCYREPGVMRASLQTYAAFAQDAEANRAFLQDGKIEVPSLVIGGSASLGPVIGRMAEEIAVDPQVVTIQGSGHFVQNEAPDRLTQELVTFIERHRQDSR